MCHANLKYFNIVYWEEGRLGERMEAGGAWLIGSTLLLGKQNAGLIQDPHEH